MRARSAGAATCPCAVGRRATRRGEGHGRRTRLCRGDERKLKLDWRQAPFRLGAAGNRPLTHSFCTRQVAQIRPSPRLSTTLLPSGGHRPHRPRARRPLRARVGLARPKPPQVATALATAQSCAPLSSQKVGPQLYCLNCTTTSTSSGRDRLEALSLCRRRARPSHPQSRPRPHRHSPHRHRARAAIHRVQVGRVMPS